MKKKEKIRNRGQNKKGGLLKRRSFNPFPPRRRIGEAAEGVEGPEKNISAVNKL